MLRRTLPLIGAMLVFSIVGVVTAGDAMRRSHATAQCQGALPAFETSLRKRPLAIANEGDAQAFVSCDFETSAAGTGLVSASFINRSTTTALVSCTLVEGRASNDNVPQYFPRSFMLSPQATSLTFNWTAATTIGDNFRAPAISCLLQPGVEIFRVGYEDP